MKRWLLGGIAALTVGYLGWLPFPCTDAGELYVVETLLLEQEGRDTVLCTGELTGRGTSVSDALADLERQAPGQLFLRQVQRLIFCGGAETGLDPLLLPEDLPMGAAVYCTRTPAEELAQEIDHWNQVLEAQERREAPTPTMAELQNSALARERLELGTLGWEEHRETA